MRRVLWLSIAMVGAASTAQAQDEAAGDNGFDALMAEANAPVGDGDGDAPADGDAAEAATVRVPLGAFLEVARRLAALDPARHREGRRPPRVTIGESHYTGQQIDGALSLQLRLTVALRGDGEWKTVPLVGDDVVLAKATVGGESIPVTARDGYQVWITRATGDVSIELSLLVPARGPRGAIEYEFRAVRSPVTRFSCRFPIAGLEPRLDGVVQSAVKAEDGGTRIDATLRPTTAIRVIGYRDPGDDKGARARVYAETLNLASVDDAAVEVFSVLRYTILYAGAREFEIELPRGVRVISAEGRGAFTYAVTDTGSVQLLRGETAFPIRDSYEISLRLEQPLAPGAETSFEVPLPRTRGAERENGWLAIEVPGKLQLDEASRGALTPVDVRQLPPALIQSAVGPILRAYRTREGGARGFTLRARRLPARDTVSEAIDRVRAFSVVSTGGRVLTEMRITLRNRLRHTLALRLRPGATVRSAMLDGRPVKPSRDQGGRLILPLERSRGHHQLEPITVHVVIDDRVESFGWYGEPELELPAVELPASAVVWSVFLPRGNVYSALRGDTGDQKHAGNGRWSEPIAPDDQGGAAAAVGAANELGGDGGSSALAGPMPVRIELPKEGIRVEHERYWLGADRPARVSIRYLDRRLRPPLALALGLIALLCGGVAARAGARFGERGREAGAIPAASRREAELRAGFGAARPEIISRAARAASAVVGVAALAGVVALAGVSIALVFAAGTVLVAIGWSRLRGLRERVAQWAITLPERFRDDRARAAAEAEARRELDTGDGLAPTSVPTTSRLRRFVRQLAAVTWKLALAGGFAVVTVELARSAAALAAILLHPFGG